MKHLSLLVGLLFGLALGAAFCLGQTAPEILLKAETTVTTAWIGQKVLLHIEVLSPDGWAQITDFGDITVPGAYLVPNNNSGSRSQQTLNGKSWTGQRYTLWLFPQRAGRLEVPALPVTVKVRQWGSGAHDVEYQMKTPEANLMVQVPPGAENVRGLVSTSQLTANQTWSSDSLSFSMSSSLTRRIELSAGDVSGMAFQPLAWPEIVGLGIYPSQPEVGDKSERGTLRGQRTEEVTYVFLRPGEFEIPEIVVTWWDVQQEKLMRTELPGRKLTVSGELAADATLATTDAERSFDWWPWLTVTSVVIVFRLLWRPASHRWRLWRKVRRESEAAYFRLALASLAGEDPTEITTAVMQWLDRLSWGMRPARLDLFLARYGDEESLIMVAALAECLASGKKFGSCSALRTELKTARGRYLKQVALEQETQILPELN